MGIWIVLRRVEANVPLPTLSSAMEWAESVDMVSSASKLSAVPRAPAMRWRSERGGGVISRHKRRSSEAAPASVARS